MFRWADRIGIPARLLDAPIWEASRSLATPEGNCIVTMGDGSWSPTGENLDPANWVIMREWVARGNTLIIVTAEPEALPTELRKDLIPSTINEIRRAALSWMATSVDSRLETTQAPVINGGRL